MLRLIIQIVVLLFPSMVFADDASNIGSIADNLMEPASMLGNFIGNAAIIIGATFLFASFIKYMQHRRNPMHVTLSDVVFLVIFGVLLICLPVAYKLMYSEPPIVITDTHSVLQHKNTPNSNPSQK